MLRFDDLQLFVRAADLGSLSAAARGMDMSPAGKPVNLLREMLARHCAELSSQFPTLSCDGH
jgi:hypothetical protein